MHTFLAASATGQGEQACAQLTGQEQTTLASAGSGSCAKLVNTLGVQLTARQRQQVEAIKPSVTVRGSSATARYESVTGPHTRTLTLEQTGGKWRISSLPSGG